MKLQYRFILVNRFIHLHHMNIRTAVIIMQKAQQLSGSSIDAERDQIKLTFAYRPNNDGNPAKMFTFKNADLLRASSEKCEHRRSEFEHLMREAIQNGTPTPIRVVLQVEEFSKSYIWCDQLDPEMAPELAAVVDEYSGAWATALQRHLREGIVLARNLRSGKMVCKGRWWIWRKCSE